MLVIEAGNLSGMSLDDLKLWEKPEMEQPEGMYFGYSYLRFYQESTL